MEKIFSVKFLYGNQNQIMAGTQIEAKSKYILCRFQKLSKIISEKRVN